MCQALSICFRVMNIAACGGIWYLCIDSFPVLYINDYSVNISATLEGMDTRLKEQSQVTSTSLSELWDMLWSWLPDGSWLRSLLVGIFFVVN